tara:strand:+ start:2410 stop:3516 length:1107 start_codon:yes stop_codon:yes gene_type:complete
MANKKYAYYIKGNKLALIEQGDSTSSGTLAVAHCTVGSHTTKDACEAAGGQWIPSSSGSVDTVGEYRSPTSSVTQGLQIEYTYVPEYWMSSNRHIGWLLTTNEDERNTSIYAPAYGEIGGYLTFFFPGISANSGVLDMSALNTTDRWMVVHNNPQWNGLHKVKTASAQGYIQTHTKWNSGLNKFEEDDNADTPTVSTDGYFSNTTAGSWAEGWSVGDYFFNTTDMTNADNEGLFSISAINAAKTVITVDKHYHSDKTTSGELASATQSCSTETFSSGDLFMAQALLSEGCYIDVVSVNVIEDETFELDLTRYQSLAISYYLQAKKFEDIGEIERYEYYMRQFRKQVEKASNTRQYGPHVVQGFGMIRK